MLLERFEGVQIINGKELNSKRLTSFADFSIAELTTLDIKDLTTPMLDEIEKDMVDKLITDNDYSDLVIGNWGEFEILVDPYSVKDKIKLVCKMYIDAIVK